MIIKYVKNLFILCLLIFGLFFNSFVNAASCGGGDNNVNIGSKHLIGSTYPSTQNNAYNVGVLDRGTVFTQSQGFGKKVFALGQATMFFWDINSMPYIMFFVSDGGPQGTPKYYRTCPEITSNTSNFLYNCSYDLITTGSVYMFRSFMSTVSSDDYFGYYSYKESYHQYFNFCVSSHDIGKSLCFVYYKCTYNGTCPAYNCPLQNSQFDNNVKFLNIPENMIGESPGLYQEDEPGGDEGGGDEIVNVSSGGSVNVLCTKDVALQWYEKKGYSSKLCYGGLDNFIINDGSGLGYLPIYGSGLDIDEIWFNTASYRQNGTTGNGMGYNEWFGYWRGLYDLHKKGVYSSNPFLGVPYVLLTYFGAVDIYGNLYNNKDILEYCDLDLYTADYSVMYSGVNVSQICTSSNIYEYLINNPPESNSDVNLSGDVDIGKVIERAKDIIHGSGDNSSGDNSSGSNSSGSNLKTYTDGKSFIKDYVDLLNSEFDKHNAVGGNGILPTYILLALIGLVLFRFMAH